MSAFFSPCGLYRYQLHRALVPNPEQGPRILWVMLNPSTADATIDDPTIKRCIQFSKDWGYHGLMVGNAYALRSTDPKGLWKAADPVGPDCDFHLQDMANEASRIIVAWGTHAKPARAAAVQKLLERFRPVECLGLTKASAPKHPLYLRGDTRPISFESSQDGCRKP